MTGGTEQAMPSALGRPSIASVRLFALLADQEPEQAGPSTPWAGSSSLPGMFSPPGITDVPAWTPEGVPNTTTHATNASGLLSCEQRCEQRSGCTRMVENVSQKCYLRSLRLLWCVVSNKR